MGWVDKLVERVVDELNIDELVSKLVTEIADRIMEALKGEESDS
jgi:hypothetical protein